jgi:uncharacterized membrane-anchored protein
MSRNKRPDAVCSGTHAGPNPNQGGVTMAKAKRKSTTTKAKARDDTPELPKLLRQLLQKYPGDQDAAFDEFTKRVMGDPEMNEAAVRMLALLMALELVPDGFRRAGEAAS